MDENYSLEDIHNASFEQRIRNAWVDDYAQLLARAHEFISTPCPACLSNRREPALNCKGFEYARCLDCKTLYLYPCPTDALILWILSRGEALRIWREEKPQAVIESRKRMYRDRAQYLWQTLERLGVNPTSLVEVGAGGGEFAELLVADGRIPRIVLVEPQPLELDLDGVEVVHGSFTTVKLDQPADVLVAFEVMEHLVNPALFLEMVHRCVKPGGIVILTMPNGNGFEVQVLQERSSSVPFDHVRLYNPHSLSLLLGRHGFGSIQVETPGKLDVEMVYREYQSGNLDLSTRPELELLMEPSREALRAELQKLLVARKLSSHMRCVAQRPL